MTNEASFIRRKRKENKFTQLSNDMLRDGRLSWKARGLLAYMLSMPDDWVFYESELVKHSESDGITSLRSAMKELKQIGYVKKEGLRDERGKIKQWVTYVDEEPIYQNTENPQCGEPTIRENHNVENLTLLIPINTNTDNTNINTSCHKYETCDLESSQLLFNLMVENNPNCKQPNFDKWSEDIRKIRTIDGYTTEQINYLIKWTQQDSFWKSNILSPAKLRKQFDGLVIKMKAEKERANKQQQQYQKPINPWEEYLHEQAGSSSITHDDNSGVSKQPKFIEQRFDI